MDVSFPVIAWDVSSAAPWQALTVATLLVDQLPQAVRSERKFVQSYAERRQSVLDGTHQGSLRRNSAALAIAFGAQWFVLSFCVLMILLN
jgi:hypothetical protein